jgi:hypothetical protein
MNPNFAKRGSSPAGYLDEKHLKTKRHLFTWHTPIIRSASFRLVTKPGTSFIRVPPCTGLVKHISTSFTIVLYLLGTSITAKLLADWTLLVAMSRIRYSMSQYVLHLMLDRYFQDRCHCKGMAATGKAYFDSFYLIRKMGGSHNCVLPLNLKHELWSLLDETLGSLLGTSMEKR